MSRKNILITGANRGIGYSVAQALCRRSSNVALLVSSRTMTSAVKAVKQLQQLQTDTELQPIELDVSSDQSINEAIEYVRSHYGHLDVLINNAGIAVSPKDDLSDYRTSFKSCFDINITAVCLLTTACLPLLRASHDPRVINISSGRASVNALTTGALPPTRVISYVVSKVGLNVLTLEMRKLHPEVLFQCANPGHCSTGLNGFTGTKDPVEGAEVVLELTLTGREKYASGLWEYADGSMREMAW